MNKSILCKARTGLVAQKKQVTRGGKTYTTTVWVRSQKKKDTKLNMTRKELDTKNEKYLLSKYLRMNKDFTPKEIASAKKFNKQELVDSIIGATMRGAKEPKREKKPNSSIMAKQVMTPSQKEKANEDLNEKRLMI